MKNKPKYKKGDRCVFIYSVGKEKIISVLDDNMVIDSEPIWYDDQWFYSIKGKANRTRENFLLLYNGQKNGDIIF